VEEEEPAAETSEQEEEEQPAAETAEQEEEEQVASEKSPLLCARTADRQRCIGKVCTLDTACQSILLHTCLLAMS
jgi:hypothetical protein